MNKLSSIIMAVLFATAFLACEEDEDTTGGDPLSPSGATSLTAKVDGQNWSAFENGITAGLDSTGTLDIFAVGAAGTDSTLITLVTEAPQGGPFVLDTMSSNENGASLDLFFVAISGSISITAHNANTNKVSGTFNFVTGEFFGSPSRTVSEGVFNNITYTE